ncbi:MAG: hypothetical protein AB8B69_14105, partial [Chitinophagales bacterium]
SATNLYSTVLTFSTVQTTWSFRNMCIVTSFLGTVLALFGFSQFLFEFLDILGVFTPSISAIYMLDFFWLKQQQYDLDKIPKWGKKGLLAWGISSMVALFTYFGVFQLTHAHFLDSFLLAGGIYILLNRKD